MLPKQKKSSRAIYLDHAATTPLHRAVFKAMEPFMTRQYGNPSSLHTKGREADRAINNARSEIAIQLNCRPSEVVFTAGGTESINLAIQGAARAYKKRIGKTGHIVTSQIEHLAVLHCVEALGNEGWDITYLKVDRNGFIDLGELKQSIRKDTLLISIMYANNEIGTVQNITEITKIIRFAKVKVKPIFHTDACQAAGSLSLDVNKLGVDLLSLNGSKIYGPKQAGILYIRQGVQLEPLIYGGGQERNLRSGTEDVAGVVGLAKALTMAQKTRLAENRRLAGLRDYLWTQIKNKIPGTLLNGPELKRPVLTNDGRHLLIPKNNSIYRLPNNLNVSFAGIEGESLMLYLDSYGIEVSTGSACTTKSIDPSHVLLALGRSKTDVLGSIRFSLGKTTTKANLNYVIKILPPLVKELRRMEKIDIK